MLLTDYLLPGLLLRDECAGDRPFLERLFVSTRATQPGFAAWPEAMRSDFLISQFELQSRHYAHAYKGGDFHIVEYSGGVVGRLCLFRTHNDVRVVDISLVPQSCGRGVGLTLLKAIQKQAAEHDQTVSLNVEMSNPAQRLYQRLGFETVGESGPYWQMLWHPPLISVACMENSNYVG